MMAARKEPMNAALSRPKNASPERSKRARRQAPTRALAMSGGIAIRPAGKRDRVPSYRWRGGRRGLEMRGAGIELFARHRVQHADEVMDGIVGEMRVGGVALGPVNGQGAGQAAAAADLDHVAEGLGVGRLADDAGVETLAARFQPVEHLLRAVDRDTLLVAGNEQADRAAEIATPLVPALVARPRETAAA